MKNINIIAAMTKKGVIGKEGKIPWDIPEDLKLFKKITSGSIVIMGRKTFESLKRPLPNRKNYVVSKSIKESDRLKNVSYFTSLNDAVAAGAKEKEKIFIIGGAAVYKQALDMADRLYISLIKGDYEGDAFFPELDPCVWHISATEEHEDFEFRIYERI